MKRLFIMFFLVLFLPSMAAAYQLVVVFEDQTSCFLDVAIADDPNEHQKGLMGQSPDEIGDGMLFVFSSYAPRRIWMKNTPTSLDVYFFDEVHRLVGFYPDTEPYSEASFGPNKPVRYILETVAGRLEKPVLIISGIGPDTEQPCP